MFDVGDHPLNNPSKKIGTKKQRRIEQKRQLKAQRRAQIEAREKKLECNARPPDPSSESDSNESVGGEIVENQEEELFNCFKHVISVEEEGFELEKSANERVLELLEGKSVADLSVIAGELGLDLRRVNIAVESLLGEGLVSGVVNEAGMFVRVSSEMLERIAAFIKDKGIVKITDLIDDFEIF
ncbi:DDRGK domain-containing protein 1-like [Octopus sinensis]|uniref:DDRGK domain-containing protein 1-like n=1 Tax=Octopus sinensis TaxID=2607531 RepID=A0A7E6EH93_9MOLL|nr:DDRGK domain-containing protein 1-like [Octopus sinensis]